MAKMTLAEVVQKYTDRCHHDETDSPYPVAAREAWWLALVPLKKVIDQTRHLEYVVHFALAHPDAVTETPPERRIQQQQAWEGLLEMLHDLGITAEELPWGQAPAGEGELDHGN